MNQDTRKALSPVAELDYDDDINQFLSGLIDLSDSLKADIKQRYEEAALAIHDSTDEYVANLSRVEASNDTYYIEKIQDFVDARLPRLQQRIQDTLAEYDRCGRPTLDGLVSEVFIPYFLDNAFGSTVFLKKSHHDIEHKFRAKLMCGDQVVERLEDLDREEYKEFLSPDHQLRERYAPEYDCEDETPIIFDSLRYMFPDHDFIEPVNEEIADLEERIALGGSRVSETRVRRFNRSELQETMGRLTYLNTLRQEYAQQRKIQLVEISVKSDESFLEKSADLCSHLDEEVPTGKQISKTHSHAIRDVYRATVVVGTEEQVHELYDHLDNLNRLTAPQFQQEPIVTIEETKDYWTTPRTRVVNGVRQETFRVMKVYLNYRGIKIEVAITTPEYFHQGNSNHLGYVRHKQKRRKLHQANGGKHREIKGVLRQIYGFKKPS